MFFKPNCYLLGERSKILYLGNSLSQPGVCKALWVGPRVSRGGEIRCLFLRGCIEVEVRDERSRMGLEG